MGPTPFSTKLPSSSISGIPSRSSSKAILTPKIVSPRTVPIIDSKINALLGENDITGAMELLTNNIPNIQQNYFNKKKQEIRAFEISGKDAHHLVQLMTCRDLSKSKIGNCYYVPIVDKNGGMVNDPLIYKLQDDRWRICIADSDVLLFAKGIAAGKNLDATDPNAAPPAALAPRPIPLAFLLTSVKPFILFFVTKSIFSCLFFYNYLIFL